MTTLTQEELDNFKSLFPNDKKLQNLTLKELLNNTNGGKVDWSNPPFTKSLKERAIKPLAVEGISECQLNIGFVIYDCVCLAIGAVGLRAGASRETAEAVAHAAEPVLSKLEAAIEKMAAQGASKTDIARGVWEVLKTIWSGGCLGAVLSAFLGSLTWYYYALYAATALATIVAALATDGAAFIAEVVIELATFGFLVADSVNAAKACDIA